MLERQALHTDWMPSLSLKSKQAATSKNASDVNAAQSLAASDILRPCSEAQDCHKPMLSNRIRKEAEEENIAK